VKNTNHRFSLVVLYIYIYIYIYLSISNASDCKTLGLNEFGFDFIQMQRLLGVNIPLVGHPCEMRPQAKCSPPLWLSDPDCTNQFQLAHVTL